jgi:hypothetical protein
LLAGAIIVDFRDRHHLELRRRSLQRLRAYLEEGWRLPEQYPGLLDQYLAQYSTRRRPK